MPKDLIIDGIRVDADPSKTLLEVARETGIKIPTLCHHKALTPYGACRICLVETIWKGKSSLKTACTYPAWDGEVKTNSEMVRRARKTLLELMLAEAPEAEDIAELAAEYGVDTSRYNVHRVGDENKCIMCGLCVRTCQDVMRIGAIGFKDRGFKRIISTPFNDHSEVCSTCGACVSVCPTGAITLEDITEKRINPVLSEFDLGLKERKPIYKSFPQAVPNRTVIDKENCMYFNNNGACQVCKEVCEFNAIDYSMQDEIIEVEVGNVVVATGFKTFDASLAQEYGYGKYPNVFTSLEIERMLNSSGPTNGNLLLRTRDQFGDFIFSPENKKPKSVAIIHCVGSRDRNYNEYCSRVCCMYSLKLSHLVKEKSPGARVFEYYIDMRAYGKGYEEFYNRIKRESVNIVRGLPNLEGEKDGRLILRGEDIVNDKLTVREVDMVILSVGLEPTNDASRLSEMLGITADENGWYTEAGNNMDPVGTFSKGVFIAGACQGPKDIPDTVVQASAAASRILQSISKGKIEKSVKDIPLENIEHEVSRLSILEEE